MKARKAMAVLGLAEQIAIQEKQVELLKSQHRLSQALELHGQKITPETPMVDVSIEFLNC